MRAPSAKLVLAIRPMAFQSARVGVGAVLLPMAAPSSVKATKRACPSTPSSLATVSVSLPSSFLPFSAVLMAATLSLLTPVLVFRPSKALRPLMSCASLWLAAWLCAKSITSLAVVARVRISATLSTALVPKRPMASLSRSRLSLPTPVVSL